MSHATIKRQYRDPRDEVAIALLNDLLIDGITPDDYQNAMFRVGEHLGRILLETLKKDKSYCFAVTVEDADFLAAGVLKTFSESANRVYLACFWNDRKRVGGKDVAPILNTYLDPGYETADEIVVLKSIMAGACVVKTNITSLIQKVGPKSIHVVAPVMHVESKKKLEEEFPESISRLFDYTYLAVDSEFDEVKHIVTPGIGGNVYEKLGLDGLQKKNSYMPRVVIQKAFSSALPAS